MTEMMVNNRTIRLVEGDITDQDVDAVVNAANQYLQLGSGVAGAIRRRGGPEIQKECDQIGHCDVGDAVITTGGNLIARHVIHAVGPRNSNPDADALLVSVTRRSLEVAAENSLKSMAFPAISTGVFGYPIDKCARTMLSQTVAYFNDVESSLELVVFCLFGQADYAVFEAELAHQRADADKKS